MKIKELVKKLKELDGDLDLVIVDSNDDEMVIWDVNEGEDEDDKRVGIIWVDKK